MRPKLNNIYYDVAFFNFIPDHYLQVLIVLFGMCQELQGLANFDDIAIVHWLLYSIIQLLMVGEGRELTRFIKLTRYVCAIINH